MKCLYCGDASWRPLKWLVDDQFCSRDHRESYNERLKRIVTDLAKYQNYSGEAERAGLDPSNGAAFREPAPRAVLAGHVLPAILSGAVALPLHPKAAAAIILSHCSVAERYGESATGVEALYPALAAFADLLAMMSVADRSAEPHPVELASLPFWAQPEILAPSSIGSDPAGLQILPPLSLLIPAEQLPPFQPVSKPIPPGIENYARVKRWGLRMKFRQS